MSPLSIKSELHNCDCNSKGKLSTKMKLLSWFLIIAVMTMTASGINASAECGRKDKTDTYLDLAIKIINKAKKEYPTCPESTNSSKPLDCEDWLRNGKNKSGVYTIWPQSRILQGKQVQVYCDMETDGGGWNVIQRRGNFGNPEDYFYKDWKDYKTGFGDIEKDFWLGNDNIFAISNQKLYSARFDLKDVDGDTRYALYDTFWIDDEENKYRLHIQGYSGDAGDSMESSHDNQMFSTKDQDNDKSENTSCAQYYKGAWWYRSCYSAHLNGLYLRGKTGNATNGVTWFDWKGINESLDATEIKLRPKDFRKTVKKVQELTPQ